MKSPNQIRREIEDKKRYLKDRHGMLEHWASPDMSPEMENAFLDSVIAVEDEYSARQN